MIYRTNEKRTAYAYWIILLFSAQTYVFFASQSLWFATIHTAETTVDTAPSFYLRRPVVVLILPSQPKLTLTKALRDVPFQPFTRAAFFYSFQLFQNPMQLTARGRLSLNVIFAEPFTMIHFHRLQVKKKKKETDDSISITFDVPPALTDTFRFTQGQSVTLRTTLHGDELRRNYSICSSPLEGLLKIVIKKVDGGLFSTWAFEKLEEGDFLDVMPPVGKFGTPLHPNHKKNYLALAAGSGITPILSIIKTTLLTEPHSQFTLVYGNRTKSSILFKEELEALKDKYLSRFRVIHILSRERTDADLNYGRIDKAKCAQLFQSLISLSGTDDVFLCGPEDLIFCVRDFLVAAGFSKDHIHFELFTIPGQKKSVVTTQAHVEKATGPTSKISVTLDGVSFDFDLAYNGQSILDAALAQGADLPYACKGGVCCTCKARLRQGAVDMDVVWGLEPDELEQGFILTCQSHPKTETVVVDFDVK
ncbi:MAG TPA: 1,2-phenylacetyl-CoA epoxidase subunit PaaE [Chitinophagaceae bacterium]|nr:1,2-phenylacetyl-CoA epoxidase subunit PaaE [Chitinophagaceae bacterium]